MQNNIQQKDSHQHFQQPSEYPQPTSQQHQTLVSSLRFVEQTCALLKLPRPATKTALHYFYELSSSKTHQFPIQIMIAASIFLSSKIFQQSRKIRDILNMIFAVTTLHKIIRLQQQKGQEEPKQMVNIMMKKQYIKEAIQPNYSINNYNDFKSKILEAQQHLLRVIGFDFKHAHLNLTEIKSMLVLIHQLRLPLTNAQAILNTYNDLPFTGIEKWIPGIIYFGYVTGNIIMKIQNRQHEHIKIKDQNWQMLFCTKIQRLRDYSLKISQYYQSKSQSDQKNEPSLLVEEQCLLVEAQESPLGKESLQPEKEELEEGGQNIVKQELYECQ